MAALLLLVAGRCCMSMASYSHLLVPGATAQLHLGLANGGNPHAEGDKAGVISQMQQQPQVLSSRLHQRQHLEDALDSPPVPRQVMYTPCKTHLIAAVLWTQHLLSDCFMSWVKPGCARCLCCTGLVPHTVPISMHVWV